MTDTHPVLWWIENGLLPKRSRDTFRGVYQGGEQGGEWGNVAFIDTLHTWKRKYARRAV